MDQNNKSLGIIKRDHYLALYCICGIFTAITYSFMDSFQYNECGNHSDFDRLPARTPKRIGTAGRKNWVTDIFSTDSRQEELEYTARTLQEISRAAIEMGKVKTGALIVLQREVALGEYERTGIPIDAKVSSQLLINIFEHNTPLHDGAVIIHNNRIVSATCYLPLSDSVEIGKEMGTRHRAAVGISEVSDSITVIVSEETGGISIARDGKIIRHLDPQRLRDELAVLREEKGQNKKFKLWKGRNRNEKKNGK